MSVKTNGAEFKRYYADKTAWPDTAYHEETLILVNGVPYDDAEIKLEDVADDAAIKIESGFVHMSEDSDYVTMESHFRKWRKKQVVSTLLIEVPNDRIAEITELLKKVNVKVAA
jgi:hypothetical protein